MLCISKKTLKFCLTLSTADNPEMIILAIETSPFLNPSRSKPFYIVIPLWIFLFGSIT